ncbi:hypothetical protein Tco_1240800 [Tanacetum coccineum]
MLLQRLEAAVSLTMLLHLILLIHRVHAVSFDTAVLDHAATGRIVSSSSVPADYVSAGHVFVSADRDRIC